ncbi:spg21 [Linum perenne]
MKGVLAAPGDYVHFKSQVPLHKIPIGSKQWRYYDFGPKMVPPLICLPGIAGTADVYYKQIMALSMKGYRVISVDIPRVWNHMEWIQAFEKFLDVIDVRHVETLSKDDLASRLTLNVDAQAVGSLLLSDQFITIMDTNDYSATPRQLKDQLTERYPEAKQANLKTGGEFPFLSRPDEVNLHLQLHLRRVGVEPRPDLVKSGIPGGDTSGGGSGSPSKKNDENEDNPDDDYQPKDEGNSEIPSSSSGGNPLPLPPPESSESQTTTDASTYTKEPSKKHVVDSYFVTHLVESYVAYLYISLNYSRSSGQVV